MIYIARLQRNSPKSEIRIKNTVREELNHQETVDRWDFNTLKDVDRQRDGAQDNEEKPQINGGWKERPYTEWNNPRFTEKMAMP